LARFFFSSAAKARMTVAVTSCVDHRQRRQNFFFVLLQHDIHQTSSLFGDASFGRLDMKNVVVPSVSRQSGVG
jgi:hypothetical protein